jgi:hypothetical protein
MMHERLLDKHHPPADQAIANTISTKSISLWEQLKAFLQSNYDFQPELYFYGLKYGWSFRYRKNNKTLCVLFPETGAFTVLVTLGKKEIEQVTLDLERYNPDTQTTFNTAFQAHDGRWVYKRVISQEDLKDVEELIKTKKNPKKLKN